MKKRLYGFLLTIALSMVILGSFFGRMAINPERMMFSPDGEGLFIYYSSAYHAKHDSTGFRSYGMNYPFGDMVFYTPVQTLVVNPVRFLSRYLGDISGSTVALVNYGVLLSLVAGTVFLWLIFMELGVVWWFGSLAAAGIIMLSPQLQFLGGQFSLAWLFWIPVAVFLIIRFDRTRKLPYTFLLGLLTYCAGMLHTAFVALIAVLLLGYWFFRFFWYRLAKTFWYRDAIHIFLQFVLPVLVLQLTALLNDDVTDRAMWPYGDESLLAGPAGVFLPSGLWPFLSGIFPVFGKFNQETMAWTGLVAWAGLIAGIVRIVGQIKNRQSFLRVTHLSSLNVIFWVSLITLAGTFLVPLFMRGSAVSVLPGHIFRSDILAALPWLFYYLLNLTVFAGIYHFAFVGKQKWFRKSIGIAALLVILTEGMVHTGRITGSAIKPDQDFSVRSQESGLASWEDIIGSDAFQAILPVPGFHDGSGNIRYNAGHPVVRHTLMASLKTGLPVTGAILHRASVSQAWNQVALYMEPVERLEFPDFLPDEKPLLLLVLKDYEPSEQEQRLTSHSRFLTETPEYLLYELQVPVVRRLNLIYKDEVAGQFEQSALYAAGEWQVNEPGKFFQTAGFDDQPGSSAFEGGGALPFLPADRTKVWQGDLDVKPGTRLLVSFWLKNYRLDGVLRSGFHFRMKAGANGEERAAVQAESGEYLKAFSGEWALIEFPVMVAESGLTGVLSVENHFLPPGELAVDELMIRADDLNVFRRSGRWLWMNNRRVVVR
ncbi:MAG: hypothetical protein ACOZDD_03735 [Bacteroidota bacterium]